MSESLGSAWYRVSQSSENSEQLLKNFVLRQAARDNVKAVQFLWHRMEESGWPQDWHSVLEEHKLRVCYAF